MSLRLLATLILALCAMAASATDRNYLVDGKFEEGLAHWGHEGAAKAEGGAVTLGAGHAAVWQRYDVPGLRIVWFGALVKPSPGATAYVRARCYDGHGRVLMDLRQAVDPKKPDTGLYFKTHVVTSHLLVSVEKEGAGAAEVRDARLFDYDHDRKTHRPQIDVIRYMAPIWAGHEVADEAVLLYAQGGARATGSLLYEPTHIESVTDATRKVRYVEGKDYLVSGRTLTAIPGSRIPTVDEKSAPSGPFPWLDLAGKHLLVSYRHDDLWQGAIPGYQGAGLPRTSRLLADHKPLTIVGLGDSITLGINVSSYRQAPPYMPTWLDLFAGELRRRTGTKVRMVNAGLGGMTAAWGKENARDAVASVSPDLVIVAFGMNDFWSVSPKEFRESVQGIVDAVRERRPAAEFLLLASMRFDPAYTADTTYVGNLSGYAKELHALAIPGVRVLDMTAATEELYRAKKAKDWLSDPMHPNDFLARWIAQSLVATVVDPAPGGPTREARRFFVDPAGHDGSDGSEGHPWRSLSRVSLEPLAPGDEIVLAAGATFDGHLEIAPKVADPARPIVVRSAEGAPATIVSPDAPGLTIVGGGVEARDLKIRGAATAKKEGHHGVSLVAPGGRTCRHVRLERIEISDFGDDGVSVSGGQAPGEGFVDLRLSRVTARHNWSSGIAIGDGLAWRDGGYAHRDVRLTDCEATDNQGGTGIVVSGIDGGTVEYCRADRNVGNGGGVGIWAWCARRVTFRNCIASRTRSAGGDGGGFDLDGGSVECVVERCLAYDNDGPGYMHCDYPAAPKTHANTIRDSVSLDDGRKAKGDSIGFGFVTWGSGLDDCVIERNRAICTLDDPHSRENGLLFVAYLPGSGKAGENQHVRGCVFRDNIVEAAGTGIAFVRQSSPDGALGEVTFQGNAYRAPGPRGFLRGSQRMASLDQWRAATGDGSATPRAVLTNVRGGDLRTLRPRDLPGALRRVK